MDSATIVIIRDSQYTNKLRKINLFCNEKKIGTIGDGKEESFIVPSGTINIKAKLDWAFAKKSLDIKPGQVVKLRLYSPIKGWKTLLAFPLMFIPKQVIRFSAE